MAGRKPEPKGKRVTFSVKLSEEDAAAADTLATRLGWSRSAWLHHLISVAIAGMPDSGAAQTMMKHQRATPPVCPHRMPPGAWCKTCQTTKV
jgi:hypothetical protein